MNGIFLALLGTLATFLVTVLGSAVIFFVRNEVSDNLQCGFLGFAGGVMVAASVWSLILPGIDFAEENGQIGWLVMTVGFLAGVLVLLAADGCLNRYWKKTKEKDAHPQLKKSASLLILAITVHNIPEGMSLGLAFCGYCAASENASPTDIPSGILCTVIARINNYALFFNCR